MRECRERRSSGSATRECSELLLSRCRSSLDLASPSPCSRGRRAAPPPPPAAAPRRSPRRRRRRYDGPPPPPPPLLDEAGVRFDAPGTLRVRSKRGAADAEHIVSRRGAIGRWSGGEARRICPDLRRRPLPAGAAGERRDRPQAWLAARRLLARRAPRLQLARRAATTPWTTLFGDDDEEEEAPVPASEASSSARRARRARRAPAASNCRRTAARTTLTRASATAHNQSIVYLREYRRHLRRDTHAPTPACRGRQRGRTTTAAVRSSSTPKSARLRSTASSFSRVETVCAVSPRPSDRLRACAAVASVADCCALRSSACFRAARRVGGGAQRAAPRGVDDGGQRVAHAHGALQPSASSPPPPPASSANNATTPRRSARARAPRPPSRRAAPPPAAPPRGAPPRRPRCPPCPAAARPAAARRGGARESRRRGARRSARPRARR